ncbi:hypothetical protein Patl1_00028 [Pistacia atlantica]|uniref:Uncharacterized protein n=1 Tax=Pistacia atlantica TaxID=434234 RepID=A0ACC1C4X4_9ROSI|nr:hypothetical protein Patl1_00028 [Pistacia atlantica]
MASKPGILTDWPWKHLGSFKYTVLAPWAVHSIYSFTKENQRDLGYFLIFPFLLVRILHNQIWISLSRHRTAKGDNRIVDKGIEFDQVDRERNWDDQILFNGLLFYIGFTFIPPRYSKLPLWRTDGIILTILLHSGPVEFLYYWFHRALHHHFLYSRYHSHHHTSTVTEPITSVIHPFAEHIVYFMLFAIPLLTTMLTRTASIVSFAGYVIYIDFMNNMGHCNFEFIPHSLFSIFPPLKYLMYTPSATLKLQTWVLPRYILQFLPWRRESINSLIEDAILEADKRGVQVVTLGLLNQSEELNGNGEMYIQRYPELKVKVVDGSSLAVATVVNTIPKGTTQLRFRGKLSKIAYATVAAVRKEEYEKLILRLTAASRNNLVLSTSNAHNGIWLVGEDLKEEEQLKASKGTIFIPISQLPPRKVRTDCFYHITPAMIVPPSLYNMHSCENWLPRRVMNAWRVAGIIHGLEGWDINECGQTMCNIDQVWQASLRHGFLPSRIVD